MTSVAAAAKEAEVAQRSMNTLQAMRREEETRKACQDKEREALRPCFDAFAEKFQIHDKPWIRPHALGLWMHLHSTLRAPTPSDVPADNQLGIADFLQAFKRRCEEAAWRKSTMPERAERSVLRAYRAAYHQAPVLRRSLAASPGVFTTACVSRPWPEPCDNCKPRRFQWKRQTIFRLPLALFVLLWGSMAWAAEQPPAPVASTAPPAPVIGQQGIVLGQPDAQRPAPTAAPAPAAAAPAAPPAQTAPAATASVPPEGKKPDAQTLFQESLRQMMPLDDSQIQEYRERSDQRERALLPVSPSLASLRTARVSLEPGSAPVRVFTTANIATSLLIHDSTGQPWPITSVTNGGPSFFQVLRPELPDGNLLNITPTQAYGTTTLVVTLEKQDIPLVIRWNRTLCAALSARRTPWYCSRLASMARRPSLRSLKTSKRR